MPLDTASTLNIAIWTLIFGAIMILCLAFARLKPGRFLQRRILLARLVARAITEGFQAARERISERWGEWKDDIRRDV